jgi:hypothetical protein
VSFDYSKSAASALRMLTRYGMTVTRRAYSNGTYDPATGTAAPTTVDVSRTGLLLPIDPGRTQIRGTMIQSGDVEMYLDVSGSVEITDHYLIEARASASWLNFLYGDVSSAEFTVVSYAEYAPAGVPVLYVLHLRQA